MMTPESDPRTGIRLIGGESDYADGSEETVRDVLEAAGDRSSASDELTRQITDWATRYHLSGMRANLLRPLRLGPGQRVLDVGAGTGALTRYLAEAGADVVALEGRLVRAQAALARCEGLDRVEVVCGPVEAFEDAEGFDLVLCVGVLEYAGAQAGELLGHLRRLTRPDGVLVVAIENQIGLKYLLGYGEDHSGEPWSGVEGYPRRAPALTWSRHHLRGMLEDAGFLAQRWLFPFPDYKLPSVILDEQAYGESDSVDHVDQLVRWPCRVGASQPQRLCDDRLAHRVFLEAGLGQDVANSFLVVAGSDRAATDRVAEPGTTVWFFGNERLRSWRGEKTFVHEESADVVVDVPLVDDARAGQRGWLRQERGRRQPRALGRTVEQEALDACRSGTEALAAVLVRWRQHLRGLEVEAGAGGNLNPFRLATTSRLLPADHLDLNLDNFVMGADGTLVSVDTEWVVPGGVDADMVVTRALWWFAVDLVKHGVSHPWPLHTTVDELTGALAMLCGSPADAAMLSQLRSSEAELQAKVQGQEVGQLETALAELGRSSMAGWEAIRHLPFTSLRRSLSDSHARLADVCGELELSLRHQENLNAALDDTKTLLATQSEAARAATEALQAERHRSEHLDRELEAHKLRWAAFERRPFVRLYRLVQQLLGARR